MIVSSSAALSGAPKTGVVSDYGSDSSGTRAAGSSGTGAALLGCSLLFASCTRARLRAFFAVLTLSSLCFCLPFEILGFQIGIAESQKHKGQM